MPRNRPLDAEWIELEAAVESYFLRIVRVGANSVDGNGAFATLMSALNNALDHAAVRAQGMTCPDMHAMRSIKQQLDRERTRLDDPHVRQEIKEHIRREQQSCRRDTRHPAR